MTQNKAREILEQYLSKQLSIKLPIHDERIFVVRPKTWNEVNCEFRFDPEHGMKTEEFTFLFLLKTAYNLK
jgi:hypothetical protein